ncbi:sensor histidine kinase [Phytoactinopolyspora halotolerans]|uniref:histidine kinase n=1 Tax=Phytoactinopolyspora halotolerans TaxID=1981512 RepID=A0A6L9S8S6_9ACTN|nr:sensor histidine kinase [Phytoactinopolyspora halotolerans]NEE00370.1 sensor histidine kinase [Phytoactinopolyspora halotolerans]
MGAVGRDDHPTMDWDRWERPGPGRAGYRRDAVLAAAIVAGAVVMSMLINSMGAFVFPSAPSLAEQIAWGVALTAPLVFRRRFPCTVVLVLPALFIAAQVRQNGDNLIPSIALFAAIYTLGAWGRDRVRARWVRIGVIGAMFTWLGIAMARDLTQATPEFPAAQGPFDPLWAAALYHISFNLLFFFSAYFFGNAAWESARRRYKLEIQGDELRRSQEANARRAVVEERVRIARDLHDVVAHHVSVMGVQAAAARRVFDSDRELASTSLEAVEETARTAITELRGLLGVLRDDGREDRDGREGDAAADAERDRGGPSPGLAQLSGLVDKARSTGLQVDYRVFGEPHPMSAAVELTAYRVVQEALTNTVKHAAATSVDIRVRHLRNLLEVEVSDDGRGHLLSAGERTPSGLGLVGMRERVAVHGGELEAQPRSGGGFLVRARLPLAGGGGGAGAATGAVEARTTVAATANER